MKKILKLALISSAFALATQNSLFAMEQQASPEAFETVILESYKDDNNSDAPEYRKYKGIVIDAQTIGSLTIPLPKEEQTIVKEWRDNNKALLTGLVDFSFKNSEMRQAFKEKADSLKENDIENKSKYSFIFALPTKPDLFVQISGPTHRVLNLAQRTNSNLYDKYYTKEGLTPEEYESFEKCPTFQTVSRFAYYLRYLDVASKHSFNHFEVPQTYLLPLDDQQPVTEYSDDNCFVIQRCIPEGCVTIRENKHRIHEVNPESFKEFLTAIAPAALWDVSPNLLITPENNLFFSDLEQGNNANPDYFLHKDPYMYGHLVVCGFEGIYILCDQNKELQHQIQDFARDNVHLENEVKQRQLESVLKLNE